MSKREIDLTDDELDALQVIMDAGAFMVRENYLDGNLMNTEPHDTQRDHRAAWQTSKMLDEIVKKITDLRPTAGDPLVESVKRLAGLADTEYDERFPLGYAR